MPKPRPLPDRGVFVNCPFNMGYREQFNALIFAVYDCGFYPICALESADSGEVRFSKICALIGECRYAIHDLSRIKIDPNTQLPRFNMVLELGIYLGAKMFSGSGGLAKVCVVMDTEQYRYRDFCSDLAGLDIEAHNDAPLKLVCVVRNWLRNYQEDEELTPDGEHIFNRYKQFLVNLTGRCERVHRNPKSLIFRDYVSMLEGWLAEHDWRGAETLTVQLPSRP
jgi:hypothetical protein